MTFFILLIYLSVVLIRPHELFFVESLSGTPVVLYILILNFFVFVFSKNRLIFSSQAILLSMLVGVVALSSITNGWFGGAFFFGKTYAALSLVPFVLFSSLVNTPEKHKQVMLICILVALVLVHQGMDQKSAADGVGWAGVALSEGTRITYLGTMNDPNDLGMFFVMTLPMAVYFLANARKKYKLIPLGMVSFILYGIYLTNSRGALLAVVLLCAVWGVRKYGFFKMSILGTMVLPGVYFVMSKFRTIDSEEESAAGRVEAWAEGFQMLKQNPFFGVGMGAFTDHHELTAHNTYVQVLAELGLLGFTFWGAFLVLTFIMLYRIITYFVSLVGSAGEIKELMVDEFEALDDEQSQKINEEIKLANTAFYSLLGFVSTAFFLSRTYTFLLYIYVGIAVACFQRALVIMPNLQIVELKDNKIKLIKITAFSVVFLYFVIKFLL